jgi:hypothetical protein
LYERQSKNVGECKRRSAYKKYTYLIDNHFEDEEKERLCDEIAAFKIIDEARKMLKPGPPRREKSKRKPFAMVDNKKNGNFNNPCQSFAIKTYIIVIIC